MCVCVCITFCLSIHLLVVTRLLPPFDYCNAALSVSAQIALQHTLLSFLLDVYPEVVLLDHMVNLFLCFWGNAILFSTAAAPFYIPTNSTQGFHFLQILANICYFLFCFVFFWLCQAACGILVPRPGIEPAPLQWKRGVLTTGPPGWGCLWFFDSSHPNRCEVISHCGFDLHFPND